MKLSFLHFIILLFLGLCVLGIKVFAGEQKKEEFGVWLWTPVAEMTSADMDHTLERAREEGFTTLYATIDSVLTIIEDTDEAKKKEELSRYLGGLSKFIAQAHAKNIAVDAVAGAQDWAEDTFRDKPHVLLSFFAEYQHAHPENQFRSLQFDIEPYLLSDYEKNKGHILTSYLSLIDELASAAKEKQVQLDFVIPHFYDSHVKWTPKISYKGKTLHVFDHIISLLSQLPSSKIFLMAYRNTAEGDDGSIALARTEIQELSQETLKNVSIIVAQEVGNVDPDYVTFYGTTKKRLFEQMEKIREAFREDIPFGGIAINYWDPFFELE